MAETNNESVSFDGSLAASTVCEAQMRRMRRRSEEEREQWLTQVQEAGCCPPGMAND